jgi:putative transposase
MNEEPLLYKDKYRISSTRLEGWRYREGRFYVTICTKGKYPWFGKIEDRTMVLSEVGSIVHDCWNHIPQIRSNVQLGEYVIMPNHFHGILILFPQDDGLLCTPVETPQWGVSTTVQHHPKYHPEWMSGCLGSIINQFKGVCTKRIRNEIDCDFMWQPKYHDHLIRDENELQAIRTYIINNPRNWRDDQNFL